MFFNSFTFDFQIESLCCHHGAARHPHLVPGGCHGRLDNLPLQTAPVKALELALVQVRMQLVRAQQGSWALRLGFPKVAPPFLSDVVSLYLESNRGSGCKQCAKNRTNFHFQFKGC